MKQRLMIARALLHDPPVLFLDEPTRGLDPIAARDVRTSIEQLSLNGKTILLTTHLLEEADQLCKRVAFIIKGRIVADDTPENLKLTHGKRSIHITLAEPKDESHLSHVFPKMDDSSDQPRLAITWWAKLLVVLAFQLTLTCVMMVIMGGFSGELPLTFLYVVLGA